MNKELAIIIPAYKGRFLEAALDSLSRQSCRAFSVYVGDDCSPEDIGEIVSKYAGSIDIVYRRFEDNLGGTDLAAHWERCIAMSTEEPYIHLFSDDDMLPYDAVERFVKTRERCPESGFFRMQLAVVDESGSVLRCNPPLAEGRSDAVDMLCDKLSGKRPLPPHANTYFLGLFTGNAAVSSIFRMHGVPTTPPGSGWHGLPEG